MSDTTLPEFDPDPLLQKHRDAITALFAEWPPEYNGSFIMMLRS